MNNILSKKLVFSLGALLFLLAVVFSFSFLMQENSTGSLSSVELGISSLSPSGEAGGTVIPASCGSPHTGDLCSAPTYFYGTSGSTGGGTGSSISVNEGDSIELAWECASPSSSSAGVNFSTGGGVSGSTTLVPVSDTTYTVVCSNGGQATVSASILSPDISITAGPTLLQSGDTTEITWSASSVNSCAVSENSSSITDAWSGTSGTEISSAIVEETMYTLTCQTDAGAVSQNVTVRLVPIFQEF
ncbi:MAG: hypothetical protein WD509_02985 [Candidatus Paceibacterota bacterium]